MDIDPLGEPYDLWHDRAVFHFLTAAEDRQRYADILRDRPLNIFISGK